MSWLRGANPLWVAVGMVAGIGFGFYVSHVNDLPPAFYPPIFFGLLGILFAIDLQKKLLPTPWLVLAIVTAWATCLHVAVSIESLAGFIFPLMAFAFTMAYTGFMAVGWLLARQHVGRGDVELSAVLAPWLASVALENVSVFIIALLILSLVVALYAVITRVKTVAYGPVMILATGLASVW